MFPGTSCYPASPMADLNKPNKASDPVYIDQDDQMFKICENLNINPDVDFSYMTNPHHVKYMGTVRESVTCNNNMKDKFPHTSKELLSVLQ